MAKMDREQARAKLIEAMGNGGVVGAEAYAYFWNERGKDKWPLISEMGWIKHNSDGSTAGATMMRCDPDASKIIVAAESYVAALMEDCVAYEKREFHKVLVERLRE